MFVDEIKVYARAGHGGKGAVAFLRETFRPKGGPSGGNGGRGGDVILEADHDLNNLLQQFYQPRLLAQDGEGGKGKGMDGKAGKDLIIKVPCGTMVWRLKDPVTPVGEIVEGDTVVPAGDVGEVDEDEGESASDEPSEADESVAAPARRPLIRTSMGVRAVEINLAREQPSATDDEQEAGKGELVCDLTTHGQRFVLCAGGRGGLGNRNFATAVRQTPRFAQPGEAGGEGNYLFELRLVAEVGLVGFPNAGKSTLLTAISHARPRIAPYPFTTLTPQVGIVEYDNFERLTVCDVPGLIEGAHANAGLGHAFLRHIRRCPVLVIVLDMNATDNREPWDDYRTLLGELEQYDPTLLERPRLVVANKMDEPNAAAKLKSFKRRIRGVRVLEMSAAFDEGVTEFKEAIRQAVREERARLQAARGA